MTPPNLDEWVYRPVIAGLWQQHELWDGTYSFSDLLDAHEILDVKFENERRARKAADNKRKMLQGKA